jgi:hypothetical protein
MNGNLSVEARKTLEDKKVLIAQQAAEKINKLNDELYAQERATVNGYVNNVAGSWNSSLQGMLAGTTTFGAAMKKVFADLIIYIIEQLEQKLIFEKAATAITTALYGEETAAKVAGEAVKTAATETSVAARIGAELSAAASNIATYISDAMAFIGAQIAKVFAGLSAFFSSMGPAGIAVAAGLAAGVGAAAVGMIKKFDVGTDYITQSGLAMVHQGEAIVPAASNGPFTGANGGGGGGGSVTNTVNISAVDAQSIANMFQNNSAIIGQIVGKYAKNNPSFARAT